MLSDVIKKLRDAQNALAGVEDYIVDAPSIGMVSQRAICYLSLDISFIHR